MLNKEHANGFGSLHDGVAMITNNKYPRSTSMEIADA